MTVRRLYPRKTVTNEVELDPRPDLDAGQVTTSMTGAMPLDALCEVLDNIPDEASDITIVSSEQGFKIYWTDTALSEPQWLLAGEILTSSPVE